MVEGNLNYLLKYPNKYDQSLFNDNDDKILIISSRTPNPPSLSAINVEKETITNITYETTNELLTSKRLMVYDDIGE